MVTILGIFVIFFVFFSLLKRRQEWLLYGAIFFSGFSGSSVLNIFGTSIQPSLFLFLIYFIIQLLRKHIKNNCPKLLIFFFIYCLFSLLFPFLLKNQSVEIMDQSGSLSQLSFSLSNIIHIFYLLFCLLFLNTLMAQGNSAKINKTYFNSYKLGFYAVCLICIYQVFAFQFNLPFDILFRQSVHGNLQGTRLYGPCIEASMLCYYLIPSILLILFSKRHSLIDYIFIVVAFIIGTYTKSSTFLVGYVLIVASIFVYFLINKQHLFCFVFFIMIMLVLILTFVVKLSFLYDNVMVFIEKLQRNNVSGLERFDSFERMIKVGISYPFGVGFGSCRSKDLFSTWLCNIGIIGFLIYSIFLVSVMVGFKKNFSKFIPFIVVNILMFVSVPEPYNFFIWFLLYYAIFQKRKRTIKCIYINDKKTVLIARN